MSDSDSSEIERELDSQALWSAAEHWSEKPYFKIEEGQRLMANIGDEADPQWEQLSPGNWQQTLFFRDWTLHMQKQMTEGGAPYVMNTIKTLHNRLMTPESAANVVPALQQFGQQYLQFLVQGQSSSPQMEQVFQTLNSFAGKAFNLAKR